MVDYNIKLPPLRSALRAGTQLFVDCHLCLVFCSLFLLAFIFTMWFLLAFPLSKQRYHKRKQRKNQASNTNEIFKSEALSLRLKGKAIHKCQARRQAQRHHWCWSSFNKMRAATSPRPTLFCCVPNSCKSDRETSIYCHSTQQLSPPAPQPCCPWHPKLLCVHSGLVFPPSGCQELGLNKTEKANVCRNNYFVKQH